MRVYDMRKATIAFLQQSTSIRANRGPASFLSLRSLATKSASANTEDGEVGASSEISTGASKTRTAPEKKKAPRLKKGKSGCSKQDLRDAVGSVRAQISTVKPKRRATVKTTAGADTDVSSRVVTTEKATELMETRVIEAENVTVCENAAVGKGENVAACACAGANTSSLQDLTEIIGKLDLDAYGHGDRWVETAHRLLDYGIPLAHIVGMLKKCRNLHCTKLWVDSTLKHLSEVGMSHEEMGKLLSKWPHFLNITDKMLQCKLQFLESIGIDRCALRKIIIDSTLTITMSLSTLRQNLAFWKDYMKDIHPNAVCTMMSKNCELLTYSLPNRKVAWLEAQEFDKKWLIKHSSILNLSVPVLVAKAEVLVRLGISDARKRAWALACAGHVGTSALQARFDNLLTAGFSHDQAVDIISKCPILLRCTEDQINSKMNYVFNVMNASVDTVVLSPRVWTYSLEKRIKYRHEVIKKLQTLGVLRCNPSLGYMLCLTNEDFNRRFVERFEDIVKQADALSA